MPAVHRASAPLLIVIGLVFAAGIAFGAVAALTSPRKPEVAQATTPETPATDPAPQAEMAAPTEKAEPTRKAEPKPAPKPTAKVEAKKPDPPKTEKKPEVKKPDPPKVELVSYEKQVLPIFKAKCNLCHGDPQKKGGLDLRTLAAALQGGDSMMPGAVAGKPADSPIWTEIESGSMPKNPKDRLTDAEKKIVKDWILSGAK
jgi:outer membrane biosynthesis protein TonB